MSFIFSNMLFRGNPSDSRRILPTLTWILVLVMDSPTYVQHDSTTAGSEGIGFSKRLMVWALLPSLVCPINRAIMRLPGKRR